MNWKASAEPLHWHARVTSRDSRSRKQGASRVDETPLGRQCGCSEKLPVFDMKKSTVLKSNFNATRVCACLVLLELADGHINIFHYGAYQDHLRDHPRDLPIRL